MKLSVIGIYISGVFRSSQVPMIPMGLKETKEIDFKESFKVSKTSEYFFHCGSF